MSLYVVHTTQGDVAVRIFYVSFSETRWVHLLPPSSNWLVNKMTKIHDFFVFNQVLGKHFINIRLMADYVLQSYYLFCFSLDCHQIWDTKYIVQLVCYAMNLSEREWALDELTVHSGFKADYTLHYLRTRQWNCSIYLVRTDSWRTSAAVATALLLLLLKCLSAVLVKTSSVTLPDGNSALL